MIVSGFSWIFSWGGWLWANDVSVPRKVTPGLPGWIFFVECLGLIFDNTVTMSFHINNIVKVAFYHLRNIAKIRKYINVTTAEVLVHAFINSKLDFCNSLLHGLPKYEINKLQSVQNAAARVIRCLRTFDHISETLKELHWPPMEQRIILKISLICFKI